MKKAGFEPVNSYQTPSPIWYPQVLSHLVGRETVIGRMIGRPGGILGMISSIPFVALGMLLNLNDNLTIIAKRRL